LRQQTGQLCCHFEDYYNIILNAEHCQASQTLMTVELGRMKLKIGVAHLSEMFFPRARLLFWLDVHN